MLTVTLEKARNMLPELMRDTLLNSEETVIVSDYGSIIMIDHSKTTP
ncbi:MAG: hypothetical protein V2I97_03885 [Desulfococcaceae bacterium]|jgi:hypothetical protein|nr:hypothetical protein [Desulfococcaceae bacterium]